MIKAIVSGASTVRPNLAPATSGAGALLVGAARTPAEPVKSSQKGSAALNIGAFNDSLYGDGTSPDSLAKKVEGWIDTQDSSLGAVRGDQAVRKVAAIIRDDAANLDKNVKQAGRFGDVIFGCSLLPDLQEPDKVQSELAVVGKAATAGVGGVFCQVRKFIRTEGSLSNEEAAGPLVITP